MSDFKSLGIHEVIEQKLRENGIATPTPIQEQAIPILLDKKDIIARAQTGTGKTLAFLLPILENINPQKDKLQALIITPTRELAIQISSELEKLNPNPEAVQQLSVYGGQDVERQIRKLGRSKIVVATPGRLLDHIRRGTVDLSGISMLVLDEADQMLHMGFLGDVEEIVQRIPKSRQTMLFSATIPQDIRTLAKRYMKQPLNISIEEEQVTVKEVEQVVYETTDRHKFETLCHIIEQNQPYLAIIFCRTKRRASKLNEELLQKGYLTDELHGDLSQSKREQVMKKFRDAKLQILVATDIAARGLDVEGVTHVFNYDIPHDAESYIHRIGRTGRAGGDGIAITLVDKKDHDYLRLIEKGIKMRLKHQSLEKEIKFGSTRSSQDEKKESQSRTKETGTSTRPAGSRPRKKAPKKVKPGYKKKMARERSQRKK